MTFDPQDLKKSIIESLGRITPVNIEDIPDMSLYMDQVTTFLDKYMEHTKRYESDKVLTKTMINNYAKNDLLPPPVRKKYSKDHLILLIFIYYYKSILSISDIQTLIEPLKKRFHVSDDEFNLSEIYETAYELQNEELEPLMEDLKKKYARALETYKDADISEEERKRMQMFSFITLLSYDVYVKKLLIEKILDNVVADDSEKNGKKDKIKDKKNRK